MSFAFNPQRLATLRHDAQLLLEGAGSQARHLEALVVAADADRRYAEAAVSHAAGHLSIDELRPLLTAQLERSATGVESAQRLLVAAHHQLAAVSRLLQQVGGEEDDVRTASRTVLVVDDYADVRDLLARVLSDAGFAVRTAANGLEGLLAAYEMRPGVIVMDVSMPVLDGIQATRLIKAVDGTREARVIAHTGNSCFEDTADRSLFDAVLQKPAAPGLVLAAVQRAAAP